MAKQRRYKCRQVGCLNYYDEVIGGEGWGARPGGQKGDCLPCWMAANIRASSGTLDQMAANDQMADMIRANLMRGGWTWADLEHAYNRQPPPRLM